MIALLIALAISNMPPPAPETCKVSGASCKTRQWRDGVCVQSQCPKTEFSKEGSKTVMVDCFVCQLPNADGGSK